MKSMMRDGPLHKPRAGFLAGAGTLLSGARFVIGTPAAWPFASVPGLVLAALCGLGVWAAVAWVEPAVVAWMPAASGSIGRAGVEAVAWFAAIMSGALGLLVALALTPPLSGPALERLVSLQEAALGVPKRRPVGLLGEMWCGVRAQLCAAALALPLLATLWVVGLLAPPLAVVTTPLEYLVGALALAWNLYDYPLTLRDVGVRDRLALVRRHPGATLGFGAAFTLLFLVPCFNVILLPVAVVAATRLVWRLLDEDAAVSSDPQRCPAAAAVARTGR